MKNDPFLEDPTNRIVCSFDTEDHVAAVKTELRQFGIQDQQIRVRRGEKSADQVDTSAKWFADTDQHIKRFQRELRAGNSIVSVPVKDGASREQLHSLLRKHNARVITHFGEWITELMT
jgi:hypothetical protein